MLSISKNVLFSGHNHLLTTGADDPSSLAGTRVITKVLHYQYRWLAGGYDLEIGLLEVDSMVVNWWILFHCTVDLSALICVAVSLSFGGLTLRYHVHQPCYLTKYPFS